jgi:hypothetical protein
LTHDENETDEKKSCSDRYKRALSCVPVCDEDRPHDKERYSSGYRLIQNGTPSDRGWRTACGSAANSVERSESAEAAGSARVG